MVGHAGPTDAAVLAWTEGPFRVEDHFTEADVDGLCQMPRMRTAVMAMVGRFTPSSRTQRVTNGQFPNLHWVDHVIFDRGEDRWGKFALTDVKDRAWWDLLESCTPVSVRYERLALLNAVTEGIDRWKYLDAHIAEVPFSTAHLEDVVGFRKARARAYTDKAHRYNNLLGLWWDVRINGGFTPKAARLILRLLLSTEALRQIEFPDDDTSPHLRGFPSS